MLFDRRGHFAHRPDHRPQGLLHAHAVDRAEQLEELALDLAQKADQPRRQPALHRVAFEIFDRVQADLLADAACNCRRVNSGMRTSYSNAPTPSVSVVFGKFAASWPVILVIKVRLEIIG